MGSLEHVFDPNKTLKKCRQSAKINSYILLEARGYPQNHSKLYFNHNHHRYFSKKSLEMILLKHGWQPIRARRSFFRGGAYGGAEWWHFQYEEALTPGKSKFGEEILKVYSLSQAQKFIYWNVSKNCVFKKNWF